MNARLVGLCAACALGLIGGWLVTATWYFALLGSAVGFYVGMGWVATHPPHIKKEEPS